MAKADLEMLRGYAGNGENILQEGVWDAEDNIHLAVLEIEALRKVADEALRVLNRAERGNARTAVSDLWNAYEAYEALLRRPTPKEERDAEDADAKKAQPEARA